MSKKQKKNLIRIIVSLALFFLLLILGKTGVLDPLPNLVIFAMYFAVYLLIGYDVVIKAAKNIAHGQVFDENFLMMIATFAAFGLGLMGAGDYDEALAVMLFYQVGEWFQGYAVGKSRQSITEMMDIAPEFANLEQADGSVEEVDPDEVHPGDTIVIRAGEKIPLDGIVLEGESFLNTAALTGESVPRKVRKGDAVISGCLNGDTILKVQVTKEYEDSTVAKILDLVENASSKKAKLENFITRFARYYTPVVTIGAVILAVIPPILLGWTWADSIRRACNFLIVSCPCALVISVPLGFFGGIGAASRIGVLVKGSNFLEAASGVTTIVMDKTGTLTRGEFKVQKVLPAEGFSGDALLEMAAHGEGYSTHPIAQSIREAFAANKGLSSDQRAEEALDFSRVTDAKEAAGHGIDIVYDGKRLLLGNEKLMKRENISFQPCTEAGTVVYAALDGNFAGAIVISDTVKDGAADAISEMKAAGVKKTVMLTGDRSEAAMAVAEQLGVDEVHADLLPGDKVDAVEKLMQELAGKDGEANGRLCFVGDGINDAPVLMRSDVGIAMGSLGSDAAIEAADIVLMDDDIRKIPSVIRIARRTIGIVKTNIWFAIGVKVLILILSVFGIASMWAAVFGDVGVACLCVLNSMRALKAK